MSKIRPRERDSILQSLRAGVTPRVGIQHIQVGRVKEIEAILKDIERIADGGSSFRLLIGDFGSGKSFFLQLSRSLALEKGLVTMHADLSPDRRIHATSGQARSLYAELMRNIATRTKPEGALPAIVERFLSESEREATERQVGTEVIIREKLQDLTELVGGYDFSQVIELYWNAHQDHDDDLKNSCLRWLRAEFTTRVDARKALKGKVRSIIDDASFYDNLKLMSLFVRQAGYKGLLVSLDELVNLYKLQSKQARTANYEQLLRILNDCLQGSAHNLGFILGGTPEFLFDTRKGLYSYDALQTRLAANRFAKEAGVIDYNSPVIHLDSLQPEELYVLLVNLRNVYASGDKSKYLVDDNALTAFLDYCYQKIGEAYFRTPRNTIKAFIDLLSVLEQSPETKWESLLGRVELKKEQSNDADIEVDDEDDELTTLTL